MLQAASRAAEQANLPTPDPLSSSRVRLDGQEVRWDILSLPTAGMPFLRSPYVRAIACDPEATRHENGALGVARLQIESPDPAALKQLYAQLLQTTPLEGMQDRVTAFGIGSAVLEIVGSESSSSTADRARSDARCPASPS